LAGVFRGVRDTVALFTGTLLGGAAFVAVALALA
jgi:hypothetical protein